MAVSAMLDDARGWRLAAGPQAEGITQVRMGVSVAACRRSRAAATSTQDVLNRFATALNGSLKVIADFGDEQRKIA